MLDPSWKNIRLQLPKKLYHAKNWVQRKKKDVNGRKFQEKWKKVVGAGRIISQRKLWNPNPRSKIHETKVQEQKAQKTPNLVEKFGDVEHPRMSWLIARVKGASIFSREGKSLFFTANTRRAISPHKRIVLPARYEAPRLSGQSDARNNASKRALFFSFFSFFCPLSLSPRQFRIIQYGN